MMLRTIIVPVSTILLQEDSLSPLSPAGFFFGFFRRNFVRRNGLDIELCHSYVTLPSYTGFQLLYMQPICVTRPGVPTFAAARQPNFELLPGFLGFARPKSGHFFSKMHQHVA